MKLKEISRTNLATHPTISPNLSVIILAPPFTITSYFAAKHRKFFSLQSLCLYVDSY
jgi:hypothetical protein